MSGLIRLDERPITLTQLVYNKLREAIIDKSLPPGSSISETALARRLEVSKTPVREAILRLIEIGLIVGEGRDQHVIRPSVTMIMEAYETRSALECATVELAAVRIGSDEHLELHDLALRSVQACEVGDSAAFRQCDSLFHRLIANSAGNGQLARLTNNALDLTGALRLRDVPMSEVSMRCADDHVRISTAISDKNGMLARTLIAEHVNVVRDKVLAEFKNPDDNSEDA